MHLAVRLNDDLAPGVVCLQDIAGSANMVTSTQGTAPGTACIMHGVGVEVGREDGQ